MFQEHLAENEVRRRWALALERHATLHLRLRHPTAPSTVWSLIKSLNRSLKRKSDIWYLELNGLTSTAEIHTADNEKTRAAHTAEIHDADIAF